MLSVPVFEVPFGFAHAVRDAHYHDDALLFCKLSGPVSFDSAGENFLMGPDFVAVRGAMQLLVRDRLEDRLLYDPSRPEGGPSVLDAVSGRPVEGLIMTPWPFRPTVEVIALVLATWVSKIVAEHAATVEEFEFWESSRSGVFLDRSMVAEAESQLRRIADVPGVDALLDVGSPAGG